MGLLSPVHRDFSSVVLGVKREVFAEHLDAAKARLGAAADADVPAGELRKLVQTYQEEIAGRTRNPFPRTCRSSSAWPSTPSSTPGSPRRRPSTVASTVFPRSGGPR